MRGESFEGDGEGHWLLGIAEGIDGERRPLCRAARALPSRLKWHRATLQKAGLEAQPGTMLRFDGDASVQREAERQQRDAFGLVALRQQLDCEHTLAGLGIALLMANHAALAALGLGADHLPL